MKIFKAISSVCDNAERYLSQKGGSTIEEDFEALKVVKEWLRLDTRRVELARESKLLHDEFKEVEAEIKKIDE